MSEDIELAYLIDTQVTGMQATGLLYSEDALLFEEDYDLFSELEPEHTSSIRTAGVDDLTPVDKFFDMNGENIFITEV